MQETIEVEIKENQELKSKHDFENLQVLFTVQKDKQDQGLKKYSELKEDKTLFSGIYPLKFFFTYSNQHNAVLTTLEKRAFSGEELLTNLINQEAGSQPYPNPSKFNFLLKPKKMITKRLPIANLSTIHGFNSSLRRPSPLS